MYKGFLEEADATLAWLSPSLEVGMHGAPFGEIARQSAPGAASALQIENGTKKHRTSPPGVALCAFQKREKGGKLLATDIAWVGFSVRTDSLQQKL